MVVGAEPHLCGLFQQALQQCAVDHIQAQVRGVLGQAVSLMHAQGAQGAVRHEQQHPLHTTGNQGFLGTGSHVHGIGEAARFHQQLGAVLAPYGQGFCGGRRCRQQAAMDLLHMPRPDQRQRRVPEVGHQGGAGACHRLLVHLLLHVAQRHLQVQRGEVLPALGMRAGPGLLGRHRQAIGQQHGVGRLVQPTAQVGFGVEQLLVAQGVVFASNVQRLDQQALLRLQQLVAL